MKPIILIFSLLLPLLGSGQAYTLDTTFRPNGHMRATEATYQCRPGFIYWLASLPGGRVMAHGLFEYYPYPPTSFGLTGDLVIFHQDGRLDTSFRTKASDAMRYSDGLMVRDSYFYVNHWRYGYDAPTWGGIPINRFDLSTGNHLGGLLLDSGLTFPSIDEMNLRYPRRHSFALLASGAVLAARPAWRNNQRLCSFMRIGPSGYLDTAFAYRHAKGVREIIPYDETSFLLLGGYSEPTGGGFSTYDSVAVRGLARIDSSGALDTSFRAPFVDLGGVRLMVKVQGDGKILVGGALRVEGHGGWLGLVRLLPDGRLDSSFNNFHALADGGRAHAACETSDGGLLIGGRFDRYNNYVRHNIVKTDGNGYIDPDYFNGGGADSVVAYGNGPTLPYVSDIVAGPNDTYYVGGYFGRFEGRRANSLVRLRGPGTLGLEAGQGPGAGLRAFPNPSSGQVFFSWSGLGRGGLLRVYDSQGRGVASQALAEPKGQWLWDTRGLAPGLYFYELRDGQGQRMAEGKLALAR